MLRLVRLGPDAARLARAVAVLERAELDQAAQLAGARTPRRRRGPPTFWSGRASWTRLRFVSPIRSCVAPFTVTWRRPTAVEAHGRSARLLAQAHANPAHVAEHLLATVPTGDGWTVEQLRAAAWEATTRGAPESAVAYLRRALFEQPSPEAGAGLLLELGLAEFGCRPAGLAGPTCRGGGVGGRRFDPHRCRVCCSRMRCVGMSGQQRRSRCAMASRPASTAAIRKAA